LARANGQPPSLRGYIKRVKLKSPPSFPLKRFSIHSQFLTPPLGFHFPLHRRRPDFLLRIAAAPDQAMDSPRGPASFATQANALLRKNLCLQVQAPPLVFTPPSYFPFSLFFLQKKSPSESASRARKVLADWVHWGFTFFYLGSCPLIYDI
jgi:hypothetical protein